MDITLSILAGGKSSRMKTDKCAIKLKNNKTAIQTIIDNFKNFTSNILISANKKEYDKYGLAVIHDVYPGCGPLSGIISTMQVAKTDTVAFIPCDMPLMPAEFYQFLLTHLQNYHAVVPMYNGKIYSLNLIIKIDTLPIAEQQLLSGTYKIRAFLEKINTKYIEAQEYPNFKPQMLININTPDDLELAQIHLE